MIIPKLKKLYYRYINNLDIVEKNKFYSINDTCSIVVNYKTPNLIKSFIYNFRIAFQKLHLLIVDKSNFDRSTDIIYSVYQKDGNMTLLTNMSILYHGPGLHKAIQ